MEESKYPPFTLVQTWLEISENYTYPEAQVIALKKINSQFGDINKAKDYVDIHMFNKEV